jgi:hypothetical protein
MPWVMVHNSTLEFNGKDASTPPVAIPHPAGRIGTKERRDGGVRNAEFGIRIVESFPFAFELSAFTFQL